VDIIGRGLVVSAAFSGRAAAPTGAALGSTAKDYGGLGKAVDLTLWSPMMFTVCTVRAWMAAAGGLVTSGASVARLFTQCHLADGDATTALRIRLTRHSAVELSRDLSANAVAEGVVRTWFSEMLLADKDAQRHASLPFQPVPEPAAAVSAVALLAANATSWITGQRLDATSGAML
jgi:Enoyl-(Acyl carrier protein) reductase